MPLQLVRPLTLLFAWCPSPTASRYLTFYHMSPTFLPGPLPVSPPDTRLWAPRPARNVHLLWVLSPDPHPRLYPSFIWYWTPLLAAEGACPSCARPCATSAVVPWGPLMLGQCVSVTGLSLGRQTHRGASGDGEESHLPGHRLWGDRMVSVTRRRLPLFQG